MGEINLLDVLWVLFLAGVILAAAEWLIGR